jgi:hypothetical protein
MTLIVFLEEKEICPWQTESLRRLRNADVEIGNITIENHFTDRIPATPIIAFYT